MNWICWLKGHDTNKWKECPDDFLANQFDPSGIHALHSHYRPAAMWSMLACYSPERYKEQKCECKRCGTLFWEFYPINLAGVAWGPPDEYSEIMKIMDKEAKYGVPLIRY